MSTFGIIGLSCVIVLWIISGFLSMDLQDKKGYSGGFWIGFLLGIVGLIYSAGLPDKKQKKISKQGKKQIIEDIPPEEEDDDGYSEDFHLCKKCGFPVYTDQKQCKNCGEVNKEYKQK